jgi:dienelactone hydrolase
MRTAAITFAVAILLNATVSAASLTDDPWPEATVNTTPPEDIAFTSSTPFVFEDVGAGPELDPPRQVRATLYMPEDASPQRKVPAVILLHGSAGVLQARERTYGAQYAAMGVATLVPDSFGSRRDIATSYIDRVMNITETAMMADAFAGLRYLDKRGDVDARKVAVIGFSYGALAALLVAYEQAAQRFAPDGYRFAAHVPYYGPCLAKFEDGRATGAPVLMLSAEHDRVTHPKRCAETAEELLKGGARSVEHIRYVGAYHQWDGSSGTPENPVRRGSNLAGCRFAVERDAKVRDLHTGLAMSNVFFRKLILWLCNDSEGYLQARDPTVRAKSNRDVGKFLSAAFARGAPAPAAKAVR